MTDGDKFCMLHVTIYDLHLHSGGSMQCRSAQCCLKMQLQVQDR